MFVQAIPTSHAYLFPRMLGVTEQDLLFALASLALVFCFMWLQLGSLLLAAAGLTEFLKSQLCTRCTVYKDSRADF